MELQYFILKYNPLCDYLKNGFDHVSELLHYYFSNFLFVSSQMQ